MKHGQESLPDLILNYNYQTVKESRVYKGSGEQPEDLFIMIKGEPRLWENPEHNKEFTASYPMTNEQFVTIASELNFVVVCLGR